MIGAEDGEFDQFESVNSPYFAKKLVKLFGGLFD